jgi:hypothetical protein
MWEHVDRAGPFSRLYGSDFAQPNRFGQGEV